MADNFIFEIGGNIDAFKKTISEVEAELKRVRGTLKNQLGQGLVDANKNIAQLEQSLINLKQVGLDKLPASASKGSAALFSLSQVARDAPFGFIAIQNNLPLVVDQFSALSKTSGGLIGALKNVGLALIGPAGLSFAFGAIIAGVTALVQKYGSFGNAIDVIFQKNGKLTNEIIKAKDSYKEFSKELKTTTELAGEEAAGVNGQIAKIQALSKIVLDQTQSYEKRNSALNQLKEINKDYFGSLSLEKTKFDDLKGAVDSYTKSLIASAKTKGFEQEISRTSVELFKQEQLLGKLKTALEEARREPLKIRGKEGLIDTSKVDAATSAYNAQNFVVEQLKKEQKSLNAELQKSVQTETDLQSVVDARLEQLKKEEEAKKKKEKRDKEEIKTNKELIKDQYKLLEQKKQLLEFEVPMAAPSAGAQFDNYLKRLREQADIQKKLKKEQLDLENQKVTRGFLQDTIAGFKDIKAPRIEDVIFDVNRMQEIASTYQKLVQQRFENIAGIVQDSLTAPLTYLFDTVLEGGKISWKELGNIVVEQLKRIAIQITTTAAAVAIADLLTKGGYSASVKLFNKATGIVDRGGTGVSVGRPSAVNFGGIQGGIGLSGQVVFVQRGTDLVGVLNRSNATINRVG